MPRAALRQVDPDELRPQGGLRAFVEAGREMDLLRRHLAVEDLVTGPPHGAHSAAADALQQAIALCHESR